jgi:uncharacterized protein YcgI (DUF1989 family)
MPDAPQGTTPLVSMAGLGGSPLVQTEQHRARVAAIARRARHLVRTVEIAARTGEAFEIEQGQLIRVICSEGPQVADFNAFGRQDAREKFWSVKSRIIGSSHLTVGNQLWSCPPWTRPMMTIIADTVSREALPGGARTHDLLFSRCDARHYETVFGRKGMPNCQDNLANAIKPFGLTQYDVHDPLNLFMTTGSNEAGKPFYLPSNAKKGDYVELYAEIDCLAAISACPGGSSGPKHHPLRVDIFALTEV